MKALLPLVLVLAAPALAADPAPVAGTRLSVSATDSVSRPPDLATVGTGVVTQGATAAAAMRDNAARMAATVAALKRAGVADRDVQTSALTLQPQYRYADNQPPVLTGYQASNRVTARLRDVARVGAVLDALVAAGANQIDGPDFSVEHADAALDEARTQAVALARSRAELYAQAAGLHVARIVSLSEGTANPPIVRPMMMAMARKAETTPVEAGEEKLSVTIDAEFELR
jgi:hypothetical protein